MENETRPLDEYAISKTAKELGLKELQSLLKDWEALAENKKVYGGKPILPNLYVVAPQGILFTPFAEQLALYLNERKIMPFYGKTLSYSYQLTYPPKGAEETNNPFPALRYLYQVIRKELVYYDKAYQGLLCIDITDWVSRSASKEDPFQAFLSYMGTLDDDTLAIFVSHESAEKKNQEAFKTIASRLRIKRVNVSVSSPDWGLGVLNEALDQEGLKLSKEAADYLKESIRLILLSPGNEGANSIEQLALDIAYSKYISPSGASPIIEMADVLAYGPNSAWIANFKAIRRSAYGLMGEE
jgi:hypothetical protein